jgi:hypothetical protein
MAVSSIVAGGILAASSAYANYFCAGPVLSVALSTGGIVTVNAPGAGLNSAYLCQIGTTANGIGPEVCNAIYGTLLSAHATSANVTFAYSDALTCTTHPAWTWLTGWYYGPEYD